MGKIASFRIPSVSGSGWLSDQPRDSPEIGFVPPDLGFGVQPRIGFVPKESVV
jgi:hypothetical protein